MTSSTHPSPAFAERERYSDAAREVLNELNRRVDGVVRSVEQLKPWRRMFAPDAPTELIAAILREVFLSVHWYQKDTTEAGFHMLGRLPKNETKLLQALVHHKAEEAEHGLWALRDFLALGGQQERTTDPPSPGTFTVTSVWWRMAMVEEPLGYLGAEYLFECLTLRVAQPVVELLHQRGFAPEGVGFIIEHATEDEKHTNLLMHLILDVATKCPSAVPAMLRCFDYFRHVYPEPVWNEAADRALQ